MFFLVFLLFLISCPQAGLAKSTKMAGDLLRLGLLLPAERDELFALDEALVQTLQELEKERNLFAAVRRTADPSEAQSFGAELARRGFDILLTLGPRHLEVWRDLASQYPGTHFVVFDTEVEYPHISGLTFEEHSAAFILGAQSASQSSTQKLAFVAAVDDPSVRRLLLAFRAGIRLVNPKIQLEERFLSSVNSGWRDQSNAKAALESLLSRPLDGIFLALGSMSSDILQQPQLVKWLADKPSRFVMLAARSDLADLPGSLQERTILVKKRADLAVRHVIKLFTENSLKAGILPFGLQAGGVEIIDLPARKNMSWDEDLEQRLHSIRHNVLSGQIKVPDYFRVF